MKRLYLFLKALPLGSRLQILVVVLLIGYHAWIDFQHGYSAVTMGIFVVALLIGWLLKPLMTANPRRTAKVLSAFGIVVFGFYVLARHEWWWRTRAAHFSREFVMWLDLSCAYWFISETQLQQQSLTLTDVDARDDENRPSDDDAPHSEY